VERGGVVRGLPCRMGGGVFGMKGRGKSRKAWGRQKNFEGRIGFEWESVNFFTVRRAR